MSLDYEHPFPSPELAERFPFDPLEFRRHDPHEMAARAASFYEEMRRRRSVRMLSSEPVPRSLVERAIATAGTAPSGAHRQPWQFVVTGSPDMKRAIRLAAEEEERVNYREHRMNEEWQEALAPLGTDEHKELLEVAPWLVVLFEQRYELVVDGGDGDRRRHNYYVKESCGIAAGLFIAALHHMGLTTLTHTPTPMGFLREILGRGAHERPMLLFPVGYPHPDARVPRLARKPLGEIMTVVGSS